MGRVWRAAAVVVVTAALVTAYFVVRAQDVSVRPPALASSEACTRAMGFAPYGEYWRNLRRISATHLFSPRRITAFGKFRAQIGLQMVEEIKGLMEERGEVGVKKVLHFGSLNNVMMSVFGKSYDFGARNGDHGSDGVELEYLVSEGYDLLGVFNWGDHFPLLRSLDLQGVRRRCRKLCEKVNAFVGGIIEDHRMKRRLKGERNEEDESSGDFVDVLLDLEKENRLSDSDMIAVLWASPLLSAFQVLFIIYMVCFAPFFYEKNHMFQNSVSFSWARVISDSCSSKHAIENFVVGISWR